MTKSTDSHDRRASMTQQQRANLEGLALVTERFHQQNLRMDLGLRIGFRELENRHGVNVRGTGEAGGFTPEVRAVGVFDHE